MPALTGDAPDKATLRARALRRRRALAGALSPCARDALEAALRDRVLPHLSSATIAAAYHPTPDEIDPAPILAALHAEQRVALPWFAGRDAPMRFRQGPAVVPGPWGMQPSAAAPVLRPDALLVPLVLADRCGARLGRGGGHYDRVLARLREGGPVLAIGIGWDDQLSDEPLPVDPWDEPLDAVATPSAWAACR